MAPVIVLAHGGAGDIAAASTDRSRVVLVEPGSQSATVHRLADAMTRFSRATSVATGPMIDKEGAARRLGEWLCEATAHSDTPEMSAL